MAHDEQWLTPRLQTAATLCNQTPAATESPLWLGVDLGTCDVVSMVVDRDGQPVAVCLDWADVVRDGIVWDFFGAVTIVRRHLDTLEQQFVLRLSYAATSFPPGTDPRISINVLESAGLEVSHVLDEPTAVADLLQLDNAGVVDIGGVLRYGIPEFRLPKTVLDDFEYRHLRLKGIKVRPNTDVGKALKIEDLFRDGYKAIFIGTGVWRPNTLHIKGESLGNVHYAINYLQNPDVYHLGNRVIVIGAGNAAMDVARTAIRHGTRHLECFSLSSHITASEYEASYAKLEGVNFIFNKKPLEITDKGVVFIDLNEAEDGTLTEIPGTEKLYPADSVIVSISQGPCTTITDSTKNLKTTPRGLFETDEVGRTSIPGIFASGDAVKGARTVVEAVAYSKNVAEAMHEYMQTLPPDLPDEYANVPVAEYDEGN